MICELYRKAVCSCWTGNQGQAMMRFGDPLMDRGTTRTITFASQPANILRCSISARRDLWGRLAWFRNPIIPFLAWAGAGRKPIARETTLLCVLSYLTTSSTLEDMPYMRNVRSCFRS